jgi:hypothetical protein
MCDCCSEEYGVGGRHGAYDDDDDDDGWVV